MSASAVDPATRTYHTVNPATGEPIASHPTLTDAQAEVALTKAHAAFQVWRDVPLQERIRLGLKVADLIEANKEEIARLNSTEMGKPLFMSIGETMGAASMFRYYAELAPQLLADVEVTAPGLKKVLMRREPIGVVLGIEPWNAPVAQAMRAAAPNLILGNTVLLKPSEVTPACTLFLDHLFLEAGFPEGAYQTVLVSTEQVSTYIADKRVRAVTLTGSDRAGSIVGAQASQHLKPVVLELGGSDAFVVLDSADVELAATTAARCRLAIGGQVCASPKRIIVADSVADEFIEKFVPVFTNQTLGDPFDQATTMGPLSSVVQAERLQAQYDDAKAKGVTVLADGGRVDGPGAFFKPAVVTGITPEMRIYSEEAFGPLAMIYRVPDADAAIELANSSDYGLGGTVFGEESEAMKVAERLDTGGVGINNWIGARNEISFGGVKRSGVGRELGPFGLDAFSNIKTYATA